MTSYLTKNVNGIILDILEKKELVGIELEITLFQPDPSQKSKFVIFGKLLEYRPELSGRPILLKIGDIVTGEAQFNIIDNKFDSFPKTLVEVFLQDPVFLNIDWFNSL